MFTESSKPQANHSQETKGQLETFNKSSTKLKAYKQFIYQSAKKEHFKSKPLFSESSSQLSTAKKSKFSASFGKLGVPESRQSFRRIQCLKNDSPIKVRLIGHIADLFSKQFERKLREKSVHTIHNIRILMDDSVETTIVENKVEVQESVIERKVKEVPFFEISDKNIERKKLGLQKSTKKQKINEFLKRTARIKM